MRGCHVGSLTVVALAFAASHAWSAPSGRGQAAGEPQYRVLVTGEVRYPGRPTLTESTMTVADALAAVGSPTANAGEDVVVIRPMRPGGGPERVVIALKDVELDTPGIDMSLRDGDVVNVPSSPRYLISGFVKRPGAYKLRRGTTVSQALGLAGGLTSEGNDRRIRITRTVNHKSTELTAHLDDLLLADDEIKVQRKMF